MRIHFLIEYLHPNVRNEKWSSGMEIEQMYAVSDCTVVIGVWGHTTLVHAANISNILSELHSPSDFSEYLLRSYLKISSSFVLFVVFRNVDDHFELLVSHCIKLHVVDFFYSILSFRAFVVFALCFLWDFVFSFQFSQLTGESSILPQTCFQKVDYLSTDLSVGEIFPRVWSSEERVD